jgi:hypothetical protein
VQTFDGVVQEYRVVIEQSQEFLAAEDRGFFASRHFAPCGAALCEAD